MFAFCASSKRPRPDTSDVTQRPTETWRRCRDMVEEMEESQITSNEDNII